jgi:hypothetical protein
VKVYKHFSHTTPFSLAENDQELAEIMRLKYPKACSNLETGAEFFARMVEDVRKFEAWKVIGFTSFEEFCRDKLGKTLTEVEEIVETVKEIGGDCTLGEVQEVIQQRKADAIMKLLADNPKAKSQDIADKTGTTKRYVNKVRKEGGNIKRVNTATVPTPKPPIVRLTIDPIRTAANIHAKMGAEYCQKLIAALQEITNV